MAEILVPLSLARGDFEVFSQGNSHHGKWVLSIGPIFAFGCRLQKEAEKVRAPDLLADVLFSFEDASRNRWANHPDLTVKAAEFWPLETEVVRMDGRREKVARFGDHKAWVASRAWTKCRLEAGRIRHPELFALDAEQIVENLRAQKPPPVQRASARLYDEFGYPRFLKIEFGVRAEA